MFAARKDSDLGTITQANQNSTSLALISSRVNIRKTFTLAGYGDTSLKSMKRIATDFAQSAQLFQGMENEIMSETFRWAPPEPEAIVANDPILYEPSTKPTSQTKWAVRYNQDLMKCLHTTCSNFEHASRNVLDNHAIEELGVMFSFPTHVRVHLVCDLSARVCETIMLEHAIQPGTIETDTVHVSKNMWRLPTKLTFEPSVQTIASVYDDVDATRKTGGIGMDVVILQLCELDGANDQHCHQSRLQYQIVRQIPVRKLRLKRHKPKPDRSFVHDALTDQSDADHDDHDDVFWGVVTPMTKRTSMTMMMTHLQTHCLNYIRKNFLEKVMIRCWMSWKTNWNMINNTKICLKWMISING